jgi:hypothetical protein
MIYQEITEIFFLLLLKYSTYLMNYILQASKFIYFPLCSYYCFLINFCHSTAVYFHPLTSEGCDSSVGIALGYGLDDWGSRVQFPVGTGNFSLHHHIQNGYGAYPANGYQGLGIKRPGREADHSPPSSAEAKE